MNTGVIIIVQKQIIELEISVQDSDEKICPKMDTEIKMNI